MAWSVPCPECGTQNEPDGSGAVLCSRCGFFSRAPGPGPASPAAAVRAATYGGMGEIEAHLTELGIGYERVSETSIQVVRQIGPQTVHVTIDTARTIRIVSAQGVKALSLADSAQTRLHFDPEWKERYDFDLALEDKTFALMNAAGDDPAPEPAPLPVTKPSQPPVPVVGFTKPPTQPLGMQRVPSSPTVPSQKPAQIAASMLEALGSVPQEEAPQSLAELSAMIPKRADAPPAIAEPLPPTPLPVPAVILPSTPDGKPPVLAPAREGEVPLPPVWRSTTPAPPPLGAEPPRPSGRIHIGNGISRDIIDVPIAARVEQVPAAALEAPQPAPEELPSLEATAETRSDDASVVVAEPDLLPYRPSGERRTPGEPAPRPPPPVLHRFDEGVSDDTTRVPTAPRAMAARARRSTAVWLGLLGLAVGAAIGLQFAAPAKVAALFPPTAASEVRAGAQSAREGDVDAALAHFRRAAELDPAWAPAWRNLGVAYALKGDQVQSERAYRKYLELEPDPELARQVRALLGEK